MGLAVTRESRLYMLVGRRTCAIPTSSVVETMRPLPVERLGRGPAFLRGVAVIRGAPVPVLDLDALLGGDGEAAAARFVVVRASADRRAALAVGAVLGVRDLPAEALEEMPPLLRQATADAVDAIGTLDAALLVVLGSARLVPESVWEGLAAGQAGP
jgi:purine-binding chemotaxis protein CheW